ncbi:MAG TPA: zf-HC2 domain-containing protein [Streptosporangiaceae bacterium]|nr:zf-HC2 domain-containing protein [Streptosporangiaceae bacterium]
MTPANTSGCGEIRQLLGVYVVGAIDPAERSVVDQHLAGCSACRDELAGLAGLPALLGRVSLAEAERSPGDQATATQPPEQLLDSMLDEMAKRRKARRQRSVLLGVVAVAASVVVAVGAFAGVDALVSGPAAPRHVAAGPTWDKASGRGTAAHVTAIVKYLPRHWGTELNVWVMGIPRGTNCQLWVTDAAGQRTMAGSWVVPANERDASYPGSTSVPAASISSFQITSHGQTLVTLSS